MAPDLGTWQPDLGWDIRTQLYLPGDQAGANSASNSTCGTREGRADIDWEGVSWVEDGYTHVQTGVLRFTNVLEMVCTGPFGDDHVAS